jgi:hypothetical protein
MMATKQVSRGVWEPLACHSPCNHIIGAFLATAKSEAYFERALAVSRTQQAKSWELRSMARLWRDQGKSDQARNDGRPRDRSGSLASA